MNKNFKKVQEKGFVFIQMKELTKKFETNLTPVFIYQYLKFPIPIMPRQFFRIISQNREYLSNFLVTAHQSISHVEKGI